MLRSNISCYRPFADCRRFDAEIFHAPKIWYTCIWEARSPSICIGSSKIWHRSERNDCIFRGVETGFRAEIAFKSVSTLTQVTKKSRIFTEKAYLNFWVLGIVGRLTNCKCHNCIEKICPWTYWERLWTWFDPIQKWCYVHPKSRHFGQHRRKLFKTCSKTTKKLLKCFFSKWYYPHTTSFSSSHSSKK